ncbi:MAG: DUF1794 domain-containing protein [Myxococcales bacterium]|nr:MAG: DUF1794 domain-containing protein [Myxococcales bacterium]
MGVIDGIDYGPLAALVGTWEGNKGTDTSPEPDGTEENPYFETIVCHAAGDVTNAESQTLVIVRYHQVVSRKSNGQVFHDQIGYWLWDASSGMLAYSITIPRAVCVLAGGTLEAKSTGPLVLEVEAALGHPDWGILQSPFMRDNAKTTAFSYTGTVDGDSFRYAETTRLEIYGRTFEHTDQNQLVRNKSTTG